jgi:UDP-N-acetyl-D-mannosaminuronic acid dehydrogenase
MGASSPIAARSNGQLRGRQTTVADSRPLDDAGAGSGNGSAAKTVAVVGLGYVGLPTALMLARAGHTVFGVDIDPKIVDEVNRREGSRVVEPEVLCLLEDRATTASLRARTDPPPADVFVIAVPTPVDERRKQADLSALMAATRTLVPVLRPGNLVIVESTVPPSTCRRVVAPILEESGHSVLGDEPRVLLAHCPERVLPGNIVPELVNNDRVIGGLTPAAAEEARDLYRTFVAGQIYLTDDVTAELCKLMENTYRDVNIALANELAAVAENLGVDPAQAIALANLHPRVQILSPGIGVGGHCIPVDPWFIKEVDPHNSRLITAARAVNDDVPARVAARIRRALAQVPTPRVVALGATYKPNTNDTRGSPALEVVRLLRADGYDVTLYDPHVPENRYSSVVEASRGADCLVVLVAHDQIVRELEAHVDAIEQAMRRPHIIRF